MRLARAVARELTDNGVTQRSALQGEFGVTEEYRRTSVHETPMLFATAKTKKWRSSESCAIAVCCEVTAELLRVLCPRFLVP